MAGSASKIYKATVQFGGAVSGSLTSASGAVSGIFGKLESGALKNIRALESQKKAIASLDFSGLRKSKAHMKASQRSLDELKKKMSECPEPTAKMRKELEKAEAVAQKASKAYQGNLKRLRELQAELKNSGVDLGNLRREKARLTAEIERQERRQNALNRVRSHGGAVVKSVKETISGLLAAGTAAMAIVGSATGGIVALTSSVAAHGDAVAKTADKLGMGISALQEYRYAAERSGVSSSTFDSSLERLTNGIADASMGSGAAANAIRELGMSAGYLKAIGPDRALVELADALTHVKNPADRVRLAIGLFGREGAGMVNMLKDGSAGLAQLRKDARATGYVLSDDASRNAEAYQDAMLDMQLSFGGVKNTVGSALLPVVTDAFKEITSWIAENREVVSEWAGEFAGKVKAVIPAVADFARGITSIFLAATKTVSALVSASGGVEGVGKKLLWLVGIKSSIKLFGVTKDLWDLGKATKDFIANSSSIQAAFSAFKAGIASGGGVLKKGVKSVLGLLPTLKAVVISGGLALKKGFSSILAILPALKAGIVSVGLAVKGAMAPLLANPITWAVVGAALAVYALWRNWDQLVGTIRRVIGAVVDFCRSLVSGIGNAISGVLGRLKGAWSGITGWFGDLWGGVKGTWTGLWDSLPDGSSV
ncbi:phage tail tape measure protein, partial [Dethiosulfovibrio salsuginis]